MLLYIVRHGDPIYSTDSLTEKGKLQAEAVGKRMADAKIDQIYSSPMGRARMTAEPACRLLGLEMQIEDWAHEIGEEIQTPYPDGTLKSISRLQTTVFRENGNIDIPYDRACECPGISESHMEEAIRTIEKNGNDFLERLGYRYENGNYRILRPNEDKVALFCHAAFGRAWLSVLLHIPLHIMWSSFSYMHTGVTVLEFRNNADGITSPHCLCYSDMSHLYAHGPDMKYSTLCNGPVKLLDL